MLATARRNTANNLPVSPPRPLTCRWGKHVVLSCAILLEFVTNRSEEKQPQSSELWAGEPTNHYTSGRGVPNLIGPSKASSRTGYPMNMGDENFHRYSLGSYLRVQIKRDAT